MCAPPAPRSPFTESPDEFSHAKAVMIPVNPARLTWGRYDRDRNRDVGEGDIHASYSADTIATSGKVRKAFRWQAQLMVAVSFSRKGGVEQAEAYRLIPLKAFDGTPTTYHEKTGTAENAEASRSDPNGFYHGMQIKHRGEQLVLSGPPVVFVAEEPPARQDLAANIEAEQLGLF